MIIKKTSVTTPPTMTTTIKAIILNELIINVKGRTQRERERKI